VDDEEEEEGALEGEDDTLIRSCGIPYHVRIGVRPSHRSGTDYLQRRRRAIGVARVCRNGVRPVDRDHVVRAIVTDIDGGSGEILG
jgi:hypothetical protein